MAVIVVAVGVLATTLGQTALLARLPLRNLLKNELHVDRTANAAFFFWSLMPWYFKPIVGIITDAFPLFGSRRRSYLLVATTLCVLSWVGLYFTPHQYNYLLWVCICINVFMVVASTVVGAYMVEIAQSTAGSGRLTAVRQFMQQFSYIVGGPASGALGAIAFGWTAAACGMVTFLLIPTAMFFLYEKRVRINSSELMENAGKQLVRIATAKTMWAAAGLMALFYMAPGLSTAVFYKQQNDLRMNTDMQGFLVMLGGIGGVIAAMVYAVACKRFNLRSLLIVCLLFGAASNIVYVFYTSVHLAQLIDSFNGWGYTLAELALMDLAVRATPAGSEGLGFSLMMAVRNLALFGTDWFGSMLLDKYHFTFNSLVITNTVTTLITVPLVLLLPGMIVNHRDAESAEVEQPSGIVAG